MLAALGWLLAAGPLAAAPAGAATIDFESAAPGSDVASLGAAGVEMGGGLVLSEDFVEILLGYPAAGTWNTTPGGAQGVLNTLSAALVFDFTVAISTFSADVLALPDEQGNPGGFLLLAFAGDTLVASTGGSAPAGDSGLPEDTLTVAFAPGITRVEICGAASAGASDCLGGLPTTVWADQIRFEPVPEPATAALLGLALAALATGRTR
jgi:hypothetical protein